MDWSIVPYDSANKQKHCKKSSYIEVAYSQW